jgi:hypothetical protein
VNHCSRVTTAHAGWFLPDQDPKETCFYLF